MPLPTRCRRALPAVLLASCLSLPARAVPPGIPTFDLGANVQRIEMITEAYKTAKAAMAMARTVDDHYRAISGVRNMDDVMRLRLVRQIIPSDYRQMYHCARRGDYLCVADKAAEIIEEYQVEDVCVDIGEVDRQRSCQERAIKGAIDYAVALDAMERIEERNESIEKLAARIPTTTDPKELAELQARISAESLAIQNDALALSAARDASESYEAILAQRDREIEARVWRSRATPVVEPAFGG